MLFALALSACSLPCSMRMGSSRLACEFDAAVAAPTPEEFLVKLKGIEDPTTHDAAVLRWIADHRKDLKPDVAADLCKRLPPEEQGACTRRATAAHLAH